MLSTLPSVAGPPSEAAVLLVLLPLASGAGQVATYAALHTLQQQLGAAIRVLCVDEAAHPDVVRSFDGQGLPAWVLMRHGVELWRQPGMPSNTATVALIMSKLALLPVTSN